MASPSVFQNAGEGAKLAVANTKFAFSLYQQLVTGSGGNVFMSPLSISVALAMTYVGARGTTQAQMKNVLAFADVADAELHQTFSDMRVSLNKPDKPFTLYMANRLFGEQTYKFLDAFLSDGRKHYGADLAPVDFKGNAAGAAALINKWVADNTNQLIKDIVPPSAIDNLTRLILVNAVYFKGDWFKKFDTALTKEEDFHISPTESTKVQLMHMRKAKLNYGVHHELNCQALELPYAGETLSMYILLPDTTVTNLGEVEKKLTTEFLTDVEQKFNMFKGDVHVWVPRFRLEESLSLGDTLAAMGMGDLFSGDKADLSGVDGTKELYVSKVLHRAVVDVNEEGTEAAAATAVVMMTRCAMIPKDPFEFRADHPFIFFIKDKQTNSILFLGRLVRPSGASGGAAKKDEL